nr:MAG TPA: hypothetical protein [Bacteriophage sp.]DAY34986.1 MAG TPA: hypothetical protein [Bacteriophage sp.]
MVLLALTTQLPALGTIRLTFCILSDISKFPITIPPYTECHALYCFPFGNKGIRIGAPLLSV